LVCEAQATGFHFEAQSCSACAAFFRRTVSLNKKFVCIANRSNCKVHYSMFGSSIIDLAAQLQNFIIASIIIRIVYARRIVKLNFLNMNQVVM
uniref:Nuclear receptor domain-containing protein n=1 Tax=Angiostrongylus cantonensis TaxID=6313 RepID=A0A0K0DM37_ANGCA